MTINNIVFAAFVNALPAKCKLQGPVEWIFWGK